MCMYVEVFECAFDCVCVWVCSRMCLGVCGRGVCVCLCFCKSDTCFHRFEYSILSSYDITIIGSKNFREIPIPLLSEFRTSV